MVVLASGDPGFFGIVRLLGERFGGENLRVLPGLSSVALAFAAGRALVGRCGHGKRPRPRPAPRRQRLPCPPQGRGSHLPATSVRPSLRGSSTGWGAPSWSPRSLGSPTSASSTAKRRRLRE